MKKVRLLVLLLISSLLSAGGAFGQEDYYHATLSGNKEAPPVKTAATGLLMLTVSAEGVTYQLSADGIMTPTAASIHRGKKGENGPPVAGLFGGPTKLGRFSGILAQGIITDKTLIGDLQGKTLADLVALLKSGNAYVNILTETYPGGEIRGEIEPGLGGQYISRGAR